MLFSTSLSHFIQFSWLSADWITWRHILENLSIHVVVFLLIGYSAIPLLRKFVQIPDAMIPLATVAVFSVFAYTIFFVFLIGPIFGRLAVWLIYAGALAVLAIHFLQYRTRLWQVFGGRDALCVWGLVALATTFYLSIFYSYQTRMEYSSLAARRIVPWLLPSDNALNLMAADLMIHGDDARTIAVEWQNSDRPPLQTGVEMLCAFRGRIGGNKGLAFAMPLAAVLFQASWICGAWALLRQLGLNRLQSMRICLALIPTGFLYLNTLYVWPKLSAAAFSLGVFALVLVRPTRSTGVMVLAAVFATLSMLSHPGGIFFLFPVALLALFPSYWPGWKAVAPAIALAATIYTPWLWYQKFYDPPGRSFN